MIKLDNTTANQSIYIAKNSDKEYSTTMSLTLLSRLSNKSYSFRLTEMEDSINFYHFNTPIVGISNGEYEYTLTDEDENVLSTGLLVYGDHKIQSTEYNSNKEIIVYER